MLKNKEYFIIVVLISLSIQVATYAKVSTVRAHLCQRPDSIAASPSKKILRSFRLEVNHTGVELRFFENYPSTTTPNLKKFYPEKKRQWFVSFGGIEKSIASLVGEGVSIQGQFYHENYFGASYLFVAGEELFAQMEDVYINKHHFRIWDFVACVQAVFYLDEYIDHCYRLRLEKLTGAKFVWDD